MTQYFTHAIGPVENPSYDIGRRGERLGWDNSLIVYAGLARTPEAASGRDGVGGTSSTPGS
jgi:hypothetical protein